MATLLAAGALGAAVLGGLRVPAGVLIGSVAGCAVANRVTGREEEESTLPKPIRVIGLVLLGCSAGARMDGPTLSTLARIASPVLASVLALLLLDVVLACVLVIRYKVDAMTAVLACAPGGLSQISITAQEVGARMGVVLAIHTVRVLAVVLIVLPLLVIWLGHS